MCSNGLRGRWLGAKKALAVFVISAGISGAAYAEPSSDTAPSYEETIAFIEGNVTRAFAERSHCEFIYGDNYRFSVKSLNSIPKVTDWGVTFSCSQTKPCIDPRNSNRLAKEIRFEVRDGKSANKVAKAVSHLIGLCGGAKVKADLFD